MGIKQRPRHEHITPVEIREMVYAFQKSRLILTAFELDVFTILDSGPKTSEEAAKEAGADARAFDRLLNALCSTELIVKEEGKFANTPAAARYLVDGKQDYMAGIQHSVHQWNTWGSLTQAVLKGSSVLNTEIGERGEEWLAAFIDAMHDRAKMQAPDIISQLDLSGVKEVLDVGGGSGVFSFAFVRAGEGIRATVFDLHNVCNLTRKYIEREGMGERVQVKSGDYRRNELGTGYDLIFLSAIVHINSDEENRRLMEKCYRALKPGGQVVIQDFVMNEDRTEPLRGAVFALNMLVGTEAGDTYTENEMCSWLKDAGFKNCERIEAPYHTTQMVGRK